MSEYLRSTDERYMEYVKNAKGKPKSFSDWLRITSRLANHHEIIRPMIIWWNK